jgi:hypothetical protein
MLQDITHTTGTVLIRLNRRQTSKELLHRQSHSHDRSMVLTDHESTPCETSIQRAHHVNEAEKGRYFQNLLIINGIEDNSFFCHRVDVTT